MRPFRSSSARHSRRADERGNPMYQGQLTIEASARHFFKRQLHHGQVVAVSWEPQNSSPTACVWRWDQKIDLCAPKKLKQYQLTALKDTDQLGGMAITLRMRTIMFFHVD